MILSFNDRETEQVFNGIAVKSFPPDILRRALTKLLMIASAQNINDLKIPPSNHLERLSGDRAGQYSIRINEKYRICFVWNNGNALNVEIVDYH